MRMLAEWRARARSLKADAYALYLVSRDPRTPWSAKVLAIVVTAYAFSPIDLIPDFIPVLGYLDELVLLPLGIALTRKLVPTPVWEENRARARQPSAERSRAGWVAAAVIALLWLLVLTWVVLWLMRLRGPAPLTQTPIG